MRTELLQLRAHVAIVRVQGVAENLTDGHESTFYCIFVKWAQNFMKLRVSIVMFY